MSYKIEHINDYRLIIPETQQSYGIDFKILVQNHFNIPTNNDLILCLIEMVTLRDITAIGEKFLYSTFDEYESEKFFEKYDELVKNVIEKFNNKLSKHGIVGFKHWYCYNSFIITKTNQVDYSLTTKPDWSQSHNHSRKEGKSTDYGNIIKTNLNIDDINDFLKYYAKLLEDELEFLNYPAYCVIVRPISVIKGNTVIPLGNIFLHFATKKEYTQDFYLDLINKFLIVWFKNKGVDIISEVYDKAKDDLIRKADKNYLPKFSSLRNPDRLSTKIRVNKTLSDYSLEDYYDEYFKDGSKLFLDQCKKIAEYLIPKFRKNECILENEYLSIVGKESYFFKVAGVDTLFEWDLVKFEDIIFKREIFKIGYIICDIDEKQMLEFIMTGEFPNEYKTVHPLYSNLWTQLFIPWVQDNNIDKTKKDDLIKKIKRCNSKIESQLIECYEKIKESF